MSKGTYIHKLARDRHGTNFELPEDAIEWRVRQSRGSRGPGRLLTIDGEPLSIPIDATIEQACDLIEEAGVSPEGTFVLAPVDRHGVKVGNKVAYLVLDESDEQPAARNAAPSSAPMVAPYPAELAAVLRVCAESVSKLTERVIERDKEVYTLLGRTVACLSTENEQLIKSKVRRVIDAEPVPVYADEDDDGEEEAPAPQGSPFDLLKWLPLLAMLRGNGQGAPSINIDPTTIPVLMDLLGGGMGAGGARNGTTIDPSVFVSLLRNLGIQVNIVSPSGANGAAAPRNGAPVDVDESAPSGAAEGKPA